MYKSKYLSIDGCTCALPKKQEVHVWRTGLEVSYEGLAELEKILSMDEKQRAKRFYFERHKRRYIVSHGVLRILLSQYLQVDLHKLKFSYTPNGKPMLEFYDNNNRLYFNLSHSNELAVYAFALCPLVGIDVEYIQYDSECIKLAKRFFFNNENHLIEAYSGHKQKEIFYRLWTFKEAYLKATGEGVSGLEKVEVINENRKVINLHNSDGKCERLNEWFLHEINPGTGYLGAIALKGKYWEIKNKCIRINSF